MSRIVIRADDFQRITRELKKAGRDDLRKELYRGLNGSTKEARQAVLDGMSSYMPDNYAASLRSDLRMSTSAKGGKNPEVRIRAKGKKKHRFVGPVNRGRLRHPLFGDRGSWFTNQVQPGFWTITLNAQSDDVKRKLEERIATVIRRIAD